MPTRRVVHSTTTGDRPADEGRDVVPTWDEYRRPYSLDWVKSRGKLDSHIKISPELRQRAQEECASRGLRLIDYVIIDEHTVYIP
ncbi:hypothetical protein [Nonomuraea sp. SYSU D8015]|uniref:hypothetical protein n=1 Tax=Nonomuraea sp. SYSU D8015 TaxID=2593644 RepID=UPI00166168DC|nr:hypothetical protein [Nonomuraea sp. SYSU D8015]